MPLDQRQKQQNRTMTNLQKFLSSYGNYITDNATINMDVDSILHDMATNIPQPNTDDEELVDLYRRGSGLKKQISLDIMGKLKNLKEDKLYETAVFVQQLNFQLNKEYEDEIKRGIAIGIYGKNINKNNNIK